MSSTPVSSGTPVVPLRASAIAPHRDAVDATDAQDAYAEMVRRQLALVGEDPEREGLVRTPERVAKAMSFLTSGYAMTVDDVVGSALFGRFLVSLPYLNLGGVISGDDEATKRL